MVKYGSDVMVQWSYSGDTDTFGYTPCAAWVEDDHLFVRLPAAEARLPVATRPRRAAKTVSASAAPAAPPSAQEAPAATRPAPPWGATTEPPTVDEIRAALATIRRIEAETPYRLVREGTAWVFDPTLARIV